MKAKERILRNQGPRHTQESSSCDLLMASLSCLFLKVLKDQSGLTTLVRGQGTELEVHAKLLIQMLVQYPLRLNLEVGQLATAERILQFALTLREYLDPIFLQRLSQLKGDYSMAGKEEEVLIDLGSIQKESQAAFSLPKCPQC